MDGIEYMDENMTMTINLIVLHNSSHGWNSSIMCDEFDGSNEIDFINGIGEVVEHGHINENAAFGWQYER